MGLSLYGLSFSKFAFSQALLLELLIIWDSNYMCKLSRFEVKLPKLLSHTSIEEKTLIELQAQLVDFLICNVFLLLLSKI